MCTLMRGEIGPGGSLSGIMFTVWGTHGKVYCTNTATEAPNLFISRANSYSPTVHQQMYQQG